MPKAAAAAKQPDDDLIKDSPKPDDLPDIEVVTDDAPDAPSDVAAAATPPADGDDDVDAAVAELKGQLEAEKTRREAAERAASTANADAERARHEAKQFRSKAHEAEFASVSNALDSTVTQISQAQRDLAAAYSEQDFNKVAEIQVRISELAADKRQLEAGKNALEAAKIDPKDEAAPQIQNADPFENFLSQNRFPPKDEAWLRSHREAVTDPKKYKLLQAAVLRANAEDIPAQTDEFYTFIEQELGYSQKAAPNGDVEVDHQPPARQPSQPAQQQRRAPTYAAPPSREGSAMPANGQRKTSKIRLTPAQREAAKDNGMSDADYARQLVKLVEEGRLDPTNVNYVN